MKARPYYGYSLIRWEKLEQSDNACENCGAREVRLFLHHLGGDRTSLNSYKVLCGACHRALHLQQSRSVSETGLVWSLADVQSLLLRLSEASRAIVEIQVDHASKSLRLRVLSGSSPARLDGSRLTSVRQTGRSPFGTSIPVGVADLMGLTREDLLYWVPFSAGAVVFRVPSPGNQSEERPEEPRSVSPRALSPRRRGRLP